MTDGGYPTWKKYRCLHATVAHMSVRDKRHIFSFLRTPDCSHDMLIVGYGMTIGDFCCMNVLSEATTGGRRP